MKATTEFFGCDIGDLRIQICRLQGEAKEEISIAATPKAVRAYFLRGPATVFLECGHHSRWISQTLKSLGHKVIVANARRLELISRSDSKSDRCDAELLARLGRADPELLNPIEHRTDAAQADLSLIHSRDTLVACRTRLVNRIRSVVKSTGARLPRCDTAAFPKKTKQLVPEAHQRAVMPLYRALEEINAQIRALEEEIKAVARKDPEVALLTQVDGVGELTALAFMRTIGDRKRLRKSRNAGALMGLRPRKNQSGEEDPQLHITKAGDRFVRRLLVTSANYILGPFGKDADLRRWGLGLAKRGGKNGRKRAKVAVARKLAVLLHRLWTTQEVYQPLGYRLPA